MTTPSSLKFAFASSSSSSTREDAIVPSSLSSSSLSPIRMNDDSRNSRTRSIDEYHTNDINDTVITSSTSMLNAQRTPLLPSSSSSSSSYHHSTSSSTSHIVISPLSPPFRDSPPPSPSLVSLSSSLGLPPRTTHAERRNVHRLKLSSNVAAVVDHPHHHSRGASRLSVSLPSSSSSPLPRSSPIPFDSSDPLLLLSVSSLPPAFIGARGLVVPALIKGHVSSVTLPSRLALLGRKGFRVLASLRPLHVGNSVMGYAHVWGSARTNGSAEDEARIGASDDGHGASEDDDDAGLELYLLPWIFSKSAARMALFVRLLFALMFALLLIVYFDLAPVNVGRLWVIGTSLALYTLLRLSQFRRAPDGVMAFCRSMGPPEVEEYMFSYAWSVQSDNVRTLAKALWESGVGVWIDTVKLCPGDEIRPMVRTMVHRVARVVIFLSPAYVANANCTVEFVEAMQRPSKCVVCVLSAVDPSIIEYLEALGVPIVYGLRALIATLDDELCDMSNLTALAWWRAQRISGAGVPREVVPPKDWPIAFCSLRGRVFMGEKALTVGPLFLAGDCADSGARVAVPWLFLSAILGVGINAWDIYNKFSDAPSPTIPGDESNLTGAHSMLDLSALCAIAICNAIPFIAGRNLFDTRRELSVALKPLLATKSIGGGVKVRVVGDANNTVVKNLRTFLTLIGHSPILHTTLTIDDAMKMLLINIDAFDERKREHAKIVRECARVHEQEVREKAMDTDGVGVEMTQVGMTSSTSSIVADASSHSPTAASSSSIPPLPPRVNFDGLRGVDSELVITIYVMSSFASRDSLFASPMIDPPFLFDRFSLFVWDGHGVESDCFTNDDIGKKLMRFLVLVKQWDANQLVHYQTDEHDHAQ